MKQKQKMTIDNSTDSVVKSGSTTPKQFKETNSVKTTVPTTAKDHNTPNNPDAVTFVELCSMLHIHGYALRPYVDLLRKSNSEAQKMIYPGTNGNPLFDYKFVSVIQNHLRGLKVRPPEGWFSEYEIKRELNLNPQAPNKSLKQLLKEAVEIHGIKTEKTKKKDEILYYEPKILEFLMANLSKISGANATKSNQKDKWPTEEQIFDLFKPTSKEEKAKMLDIILYSDKLYGNRYSNKLDSEVKRHTPKALLNIGRNVVNKLYSNDFSDNDTFLNTYSTYIKSAIFYVDISGSDYFDHNEAFTSSMRYAMKPLIKKISASSRSSHIFAKKTITAIINLDLQNPSDPILHKTTKHMCAAFLSGIRFGIKKKLPEDITIPIYEHFFAKNLNTWSRFDFIFAQLLSEFLPEKHQKDLDKLCEIYGDERWFNMRS